MTVSRPAPHNIRCCSNQTNMFQRHCAVCTAWQRRRNLSSSRSIRRSLCGGGTGTGQKVASGCYPTSWASGRPSYILPLMVPVASPQHNVWKYKNHHPLRHLSSASPRIIHHDEPFTLSVSGSLGKPVTEAQRRSARLELDRMNHSISRLLAMTSGDAILSEAIVNEARVALHYWSRRWYMHFHPGFGRAAKGSALSLDALRKWDDTESYGNNNIGLNAPTSDAASSSQTNMRGDHGARQAEQILDWSISHDLVTRGIFDHTETEVSSSLVHHMEKGGDAFSPNLAFVNIIETYLLPTAYGGAGVGSGHIVDKMVHEHDNNMVASPGKGNYARATKHHAINSSYVRAVVDATRVLKKMKRMQKEYPDHLFLDSLSVKAELNVWSKRAMILVKNQQSSGAGGIAGSVADGNDPKELLRRLEQEDVRVNGGELFDEKAYSFQGCLDQMEAILLEAEQQYIRTKNERIRPACDWYNHVLGAWTRSEDLEGALVKSKQFLAGMEAFDDGADASNNNLRQCWASPDTITYNTVLFCLTLDAKKSRAKEAEELLQRLKDRYRKTKNAIIRPNEVTYGTVLHALAQAGLAFEAEQVLDSLEVDMQKEGIIPSLTIYNTVLNAWANSSRHNASKRAESLLERMKILSSTGQNPGAEPDSISISSVISCHARSKTRRGAERGEQILDEAIRMYSQEGKERVKPDAIMFNCAISGWTNISGIESEQMSSRGSGGSYTGNNDHLPAERAEMLLRRMMEESRHDDAYPAPSTFAVNIVLDGWAKSEVKDAAERALSLMREMSECGATPDEVSYNSVLHAMTKESDPKWVQRAKDLFQEMKDKNISISEITYHVFMNIYSKSSDRNGATKAEELLRSMEEEGLRLSDISYNICIDAYARRGDHRNAERLLDEMISLSDSGNVGCRPTIHSFASVVNALAKSGDINAVARAQEVVRKVEEDLDYVSPNSVIYNSLIDCMVKSQESGNATHAEETLLKMERMHKSGHSNVRPNSYAYSMVLTCCARSKEPGAADRAERILFDMERLYAEGLSDVVANSRCYSAAITALARSNSPTAVERAFALIDRMEQNGRDGSSSPHGKPNAHCYNACIHAIAKSQEPGKPRKCKEVLERMIAAKDEGFHEAAPSLITYSTIINACAYTKGDDEEKKEAFDVARACFQTLLESSEMDPCASSFANFFLVISRHLKPGATRDQFAEAIFLEGCRRGKIGKKVLNSFRKASPSVAQRLLSVHRVLPLEWTNKYRS